MALRDQCRRPLVSDLRNQLCWRTTAEFFKIVDHVHLIVIAEGVRDIQPRAIGLCQLGVERSLKPGYSRERLWRCPRCMQEFSFKVAQAG